MSEIKVLLTPEQREQLKSRFDQFSEKRKERRKYRRTLLDAGPQQPRE
jgi:hypothetical protein